MVQLLLVTACSGAGTRATRYETLRTKHEEFCKETRHTIQTFTVPGCFVWCKLRAETECEFRCYSTHPGKV
jgi:hypothetical protein